MVGSVWRPVRLWEQYSQKWANRLQNRTILEARRLNASPFLLALALVNDSVVRRPDYSDRSAIIGSTLVAWRDGTKVKKNATVRTTGIIINITTGLGLMPQQF